MSKIMYKDKPYMSTTDLPEMTLTEARTGTEEEPRVISPKTLFEFAVNRLTGNIDLDTSAASGDDYDLTQALTSLGWLSEVVTSGVLGMKKLLNKIVGRVGVTDTYVNAENGITGGVRLFRDNSTNTVRCYGYFRRSTDIGISTTIFTVPSGFRPPGNYAVPMFLYTSGNLCVGFYGIVNEQGVITQSLGNTIREGFIAAEWKLTN